MNYNIENKYTYNTNGLVTNLSIVAPKNDGSATNQTRNYSFTYNSNNLLTDIYGPRYVSGTLNDHTTLTYTTNGILNTVTNGLGQTTTFSNFNTYGKPQTITDASNRVFNITYDLNGRVLTSN